MHYVFLAGAVAAAIALGSVSAFALENHNLYPDSSPYSVLTPDSAFSPAPYQGGMREGRAAFVGDNRGATPSIETPEQSTYYSRGR